jgi:hypothetical protein
MNNLLTKNENLDEENDIEHLLDQDLEEFKLEKYLTDENKVPLQKNDPEEDYNSFNYWKIRPSKEIENKLLEEIESFD